MPAYQSASSCSWKRRLLCTGWALCLTMLCGCLPTPYLYKAPTQQQDDLPVGSLPEKSKLRQSLQEMVNLVRRGHYKNIHSALIIRHNKLILEEYFQGYTRETLHDLRSATKSITSLLVGIAIQKGWLKSEGQTIAPLLPQYKDLFATAPRKKKLALQHLLTMSSGLACNDLKPSSPGQEDKMYGSPDWVRFWLRVPVLHQPGARFSYCTGGVVALGRILQNRSKMQVPQMAQQTLFGPMGITKIKWQKARPKGTTDTGGHLHMRPRDLAKLGLLVLQQGKWKGRTLVPSEWLNKSLSLHRPKAGYGFLWWVKRARSQKTGRSLSMYYARGNGGQFLFLVPELEITAVFTGGNYNSPLAIQPLQMLGRHVLAPLIEQ